VGTGDSQRLAELERRVSSLESDIRELLKGDRSSVVEVVELLAHQRSQRPRESSSWGRKQTLWAVGAILTTIGTGLGAALLRGC
jgi:hypothetical protein